MWDIARRHRYVMGLADVRKQCSHIGWQGGFEFQPGAAVGVLKVQLGSVQRLAREGVQRLCQRRMVRPVYRPGSVDRITEHGMPQVR